MKLKLNKRKIKALSSDSQAVPAEMTPQIAGGFQNVNSSDLPTGGRLTHCLANTCGTGYTCRELF